MLRLQQKNTKRNTNTSTGKNHACKFQNEVLYRMVMAKRFSEWNSSTQKCSRNERMLYLVSLLSAPLLSITDLTSSKYVLTPLQCLTTTFLDFYGPFVWISDFGVTLVNAHFALHLPLKGIIGANLSIVVDVLLHIIFSMFLVAC